jgi:anthranilate 1,2-dioxygenase reductase subunit
MSKHTLSLVFEDGRSETIQADEADTVYMACLRNKIRILTDCLEGACATCKGQCIEGEYRLDDYSEEALSAEELAQRTVLTCQMHVKSDCVIEFPYDSKEAFKEGPKSWSCSVDVIDMVSSTVARLEISPNDAEAAPPSFLPGQYVHLSVPGTEETRSYSFANPPHETGCFVFYIKLLEDGVMSRYLRDQAKIGDEITMTGPFGHFYLRRPENPVLMVAGGTGLAPMLSMLDHMVEAGWTGRQVHLLCGANEADELFSLDRLNAYAEDGIELVVEYAVVEAKGGWRGTTGHVTSLLREELIGDGAEIYLCGPPPMIEAAESWLAGQNVDEKRIHAEKFLPS